MRRAICALAVCAGTAAGQATWTGAAGSSWNDPLNWTTGVVPAAGTSVLVVPAPNQPSTYSADPICLDLTIAPGATLTLAPGFALTVNGDLSLDGALVLGSALSAVVVFGDWANDGSFTAGSTPVTFAGSGTLGGSSPTQFHGLTVSAGVRTATAPFGVAGGLAVAAGATLDLGPFTHTVTGSWSSNAPGASTLGTGSILFNGAGTAETGSNPMPSVTIVSGVRSFGNAVIGGTLTVVNGTLRLNPSATVVVTGGATFLGGTFDAPSAGVLPQVLDVTGSVSMSATVGLLAPTTQIDCGGNWSATAAFDPPTGLVRLDGPGTATVSGTLRFADLLVTQGTKLLQAPMLCKGNLTVFGGAALDLGSHVHTVQGDWNSFVAGASTPGTGLVVFDGTGQTRSGSNPIPNVLVSSGIRTMAATTISGDLTVTGGTFRLKSDSTVAVLGDAVFFGGSTFDAPTQGPIPAILDVEGDVTIGATAGAIAATTTVLCAGNWASNAAFDPPAGTFELDGTGATFLGGLPPDFELRFPALVVRNGPRRAGTSFLLDTASLTVEPGSLFDTEGRLVRFAGGPFVVKGIVEVDAGGTLALSGTTSLTVNPNGTLRLFGSPTEPATVTGEAGGGYTLAVAGILLATHYVFAEMGPSGILVLPSAIFGAPPLDLRAGVFREGSAVAGSPLLDIQRSAPTQLRYVDFENAGTATFNVRSLAGAPITFVNWGGNFAGPAFEHDPLGIVAWAPPEVTQVESFVAVVGDGLLTLRFRTTAEFDVQSFQITRATSPSGPFAPIPNSPIAPLGGPATTTLYVVSDPGLANGTRYYYRLEQVFTHGSVEILATTDAAPRPAVFGKLRQVGPGAFPDVQSAIAGASPGDVVLVSTGSYPSFTVGLPLIVRSDGTGPVAIDTTSGPVQILGIGALPGGVVLLEDLAVGNPATAADGVVVSGNVGLVVLDGLTVRSAAGFEAVDVSNGPRTAIQACDLAGDPGLRVRNASKVYLSLGAVDELQVQSASTVVHAGVTPGSTSVTPNSSVVSLPGPMPFVSFPKVAQIGEPLPVDVSGAAGAPYTLRLALQNAWIDLDPLFDIEMILLVDPAGSVPFHNGTLDASGSSAFSFPIPATPGAVGVPFSLQGIELLFGSPFGRLTNLRDLVLVP
jgi:hypothetical protein